MEDTWQLTIISSDGKRVFSRLRDWELPNPEEYGDWWSLPRSDITYHYNLSSIIGYIVEKERRS